MSNPLELLVIAVQAAVDIPDDRRVGCLLGLAVIAAAALLMFLALLV